MKKYLYISLLVLTLASCGDKAEPTVTPPDTPEVPQQHAMFFAPDAQAPSRASSPLQNTYDIFRVWSYKTTATSTTENVMPGYQVKWLGEPDRWQYDGTTYTTPVLAGQYLKYWDASATHYDFFAYAPLDIPAGIHVEATSNGFTITGVNGHTSTLPDILVANTHRQFGVLCDVDVLMEQDIDVQPAVYHDNVPLRFHHLLSKVEYRIYNTGSKTAVINNVVVNYDTGETINTAGEYSDGTWTNFSATSNSLMSMMYVAPNLLKLDPITQDNYKTHAESLITYYEIPQKLNRYLNVSVDIDGEIVSHRFDLGDTSWKYDTDYVYYIHIAAGDSDSSPILIDLTVDDFLPDDPIDDEQTNW